jgi:hypothetical protein
MKYKFQYCGNPQYVSLHTSFRLTDSRYVSSSLTPTNHRDSELLALILGVDGVDGEANFHPYEVTVKRAATFERDIVLINLLKTIVFWGQAAGLVTEGEEQIQGPTIRQDIAIKMCPQCQEIHDEAMRQLEKEMNSLRYD